MFIYVLTDKDLSNNIRAVDNVKGFYHNWLMNSPHKRAYPGSWPGEPSNLLKNHTLPRDQPLNNKGL
jgi:hypothetical protein